MKKVRMIMIVLFLIMVFVSIDLGLNFLWALVPEANDGISNFSILHGLFGIFGDRSWSYSRYLAAFQKSVWISFVLLIANIAFSFQKRKSNSTPNFSWNVQ